MKKLLITLLAALGFLAASANAQAQDMQTGWVRMPSPTNSNWGPVSVTPWGELEVHQGTLSFLSSDFGQTWRDTAYPYPGIPYRADSQTVYYITPSAKMAVSHDGGLTFFEKAVENYGLQSVHAPSRDTAYGVGGTSGYFIRTTNGGETWGRLTFPFIPEDVHFSDARHGWAVYEKASYPWFPDRPAALFAYTTDAGVTWELPFSGIQHDLDHVFGLDSMTVVVAGYEGFIGVTQDRGTTWDSSGTIPRDVAYYDIYFNDRLHGTIVGAPGLIVRTNDGGRSWHEQNSTISLGVDTDTLFYLYSVFFQDSLRGWTTGSYGVILKTDNGGETWSRVMPSEEAANVSVHPQPFSLQAELSYYLSESSIVQAELFDLTGSLVKTLLTPTQQGEGLHSITVQGMGLPSGSYTCSLIVNGSATFQKLLIKR